MSDEIVCIDVETTGLDYQKDEIVEVCAIKFDRFGKAIDTFYELCEPISGCIPQEASRVNGITMDKVRGKPHYMDIRANLASFIGKSKVIGHNVREFDLKFLKIEPADIEDTLEMCRKIWPGKNRLGEACRKVGIEFDPKQAHAATYDVKACIELYLRLKAMSGESTQQMLSDAPNVMPTQVYSFSRLNLFHTCAYKWRQIYICKNREPESQPLTVGKIIHKVAQLSAIWCYMRTFTNKFCIYVKREGIEENILRHKDLLSLISADIKKGAFYLPKSESEIDMSYIGMFLYRNPGYFELVFDMTIIDFIEKMSAIVKPEEAEVVGFPPAEIYSKIVQISIASERCSDPEWIADVNYLASFFSRQRDFSLVDGEVALVEKQFIFDKTWKSLSDWYDETAYMRGIIDVLEYNGADYVTIIDCRSGRTMLSEEELKSDMQMKTYVLFIHKYLPTVRTIRVKHHYIRFGKTISYEIKDPKIVADEAIAWIEETIREIEREVLKKDGFQPRRNQYCGSCFLANMNACPLFSVKHINDIKDPFSFNVRNNDDLRMAWKKIEVNKAEIVNLTSKCKAFVLESKGRISIDQRATLDFWVKEERKIKPVKAAEKFLQMGISIKNILDACSISKENLEKLLKKSKKELTEKELEDISETKRSTKFDALVPEDTDEYLNSETLDGSKKA